MTTNKFEEIFNTQFENCKNVLITKAREYAQDGDRLHNFRAGAGLTGKSMEEVLAGMMLKHTVSIYDMCDGDKYPMSLWLEKITDNMNYLLLLLAVVIDKEDCEKVRSVD